MGKVVFDLEGNEAKAVQGFLKLVDAQKKGERGFRGVTRASKDSGKGMDALKGSLGAVAGALGIGGGIAMGVSGIKKGLQDWRTYMNDIAASAGKASKEMTALALMAKPGEKRQAVIKAAAVGAKYGISPGEAYAGVQALASQLGGIPQGLAGYNAVGRLTLMGVPAEAASMGVAALVGQGMTPEYAANFAYATGFKSPRTPAELAPTIGRGVGGFAGFGRGGREFGAEVYGLMTGPEPEVPRAATLSKSVAKALGAVTGTTGKFWEKAGFDPGKKPLEQLTYLFEQGIRTKQDLAKAGFIESKAGEGLANLLDPEVFPGFAKGVGGIAKMAGEEGLLPRLRAEAVKELPIIGLQRRLESAQARIEARKQLGPVAEGAKLWEVQETEKYELWQGADFGRYAGGDTRVTRGEELTLPFKMMWDAVIGKGTPGLQSLGNNNVTVINMPPSGIIGGPYDAPQPTSGDTSVSRLDDKDLN